MARAKAAHAGAVASVRQSALDVRLSKRRKTLQSNDNFEHAHIELRIWLRLLGVASGIKKLLAARLRRQFNTSLSRFDVLAQLERAGRGLSMSALSAQVMVSNGAITGLVGKLAAEGWVTRAPHPKDRRTSMVRLTPGGRRRFLAMARQHETWIVELLSPLPAGLKHRLHAHLATVKHGLKDIQV